MLVLLVEGLHVLGQERLLLAWLLEVVEDKLVQMVDGDECTALEFKGLLADGRHEYLVDHLGDDAEVKPQEHQLQVLLEEFLQHLVDFQI